MQATFLMKFQRTDFRDEPYGIADDRLPLSRFPAMPPSFHIRRGRENRADMSSEDILRTHAPLS